MARSGRITLPISCRAACVGVGTKEDQLIGVLCTKPKDYIQQLRAVYNYGHTVDLLSKVRVACVFAICCVQVCLCVAVAETLYRSNWRRAAASSACSRPCC